MRAWLEVEEGTRDVRKQAGDEGFEINEGRDTPNVEVVLDVTGNLDDLPDNTTALLNDEHLRYAPDSRTERIEQISIKQWRSERATVRFEGAGTCGDVEVQAWTGEIHRKGNADAPFLTAKRRLRLAWTVAFLASVALVVWFTGRHSYYAESAAAEYLGLLAFGLPIALTWPVLRAQRPGDSPVGFLIACFPTLFALGTQAVLAVSGPSIERARELRDVGRLDEARREFKAAAETGRNSDIARVLHDQVQLQLLDC